MAAKASKMKVVAKQAADYERAKGQTVTAQLIQANPEINCIYAHNDEMALGAVAALKDAGKKAGRRQDPHDRRHQGRGPGHRRRLGQRRHRVQPAVRPAGLQGARGLLRRRRRAREDHHLRQGVHQGQRRERTAERLLILPAASGPARHDPTLLHGPGGPVPDSCDHPADEAARDARRASAPPVLDVQDVSKRFGGVVALDDVSRSSCAPARSTRWSARTAPASRPSSRS